MASAASQLERNEELLLDRVCAGETQLFYDLVQPYERTLFACARGVLKNDADAEDAVQEAMVKALKGIQSFRREAKLSTWLVQITLNEAKMRLRKERRHLYESTDEPAFEEEGRYVPKDYADWREIPSESLERTELRAALNRALESLSPAYREVFLLRDVQKFSISETAQVLGIGEGNVKTRLLRARLQMRDALAPGIDGAWSLGEKGWKKVRPW